MTNKKLFNNNQNDTQRVKETLENSKLVPVYNVTKFSITLKNIKRETN